MSNFFVAIILVLMFLVFGATGCSAKGEDDGGSEETTSSVSQTESEEVSDTDDSDTDSESESEEEEPAEQKAVDDPSDESEERPDDEEPADVSGGEETENEAAEDYIKSLELYINAIQDADVSAYREAIPDFIIDATTESMKEYDPEFDFDSYLEELLGFLKETYDSMYGPNVKLDYEIVETTEIGEEDLKEQESLYLDYYETEVSISKGYELDTILKITGDSGSEEEQEIVCVYMIDGKWYVDLY